MARVTMTIIDNQVSGNAEIYYAISPPPDHDIMGMKLTELSPALASLHAALKGIENLGLASKIISDQEEHYRATHPGFESISPKPTTKEEYH